MLWDVVVLFFLGARACSKKDKINIDKNESDFGFLCRWRATLLSSENVTLRATERRKSCSTISASCIYTYRVYRLYYLTIYHIQVDCKSVFIDIERQNFRMRRTKFCQLNGKPFS